MSNKIYFRKSKRNIDRLIFHHFGKFAPQDIGVPEIRHMHMVDRGWDDIGYNGIILPNGDFSIGRDVDNAGAHTFGFNRKSIGIMFLAGSDEGGLTRPTKFQLKTAREIIDEQKAYYGQSLVVKGHRDLRATHCPGFNVEHWYKTGEIIK